MRANKSVLPNPNLTGDKPFMFIKIGIMPAVQTDGYMAAVAGDAAEIGDLAPLLNGDAMTGLNKIIVADKNIVAQVEIFRMVDEGSITDPGFWAINSLWVFISPYHLRAFSEVDQFDYLLFYTHYYIKLLLKNDFFKSTNFL